MILTRKTILHTGRESGMHVQSFPKKLVTMVLKVFVPEQIGCIWMQCVRIEEWINLTGVNGNTSTAK